MTKQEYYIKTYKMKPNFHLKNYKIKNLSKLNIPPEEYINLKFFTTKSLNLPEEYNKIENLDEADAIVIFTEKNMHPSFKSINWSETALIETAATYNIPYLTLEDLTNDDKKLEISKEVIDNFYNLQKTNNISLILEELNKYKLSKNQHNIIYNLIFCSQIKSLLKSISYNKLIAKDKKNLLDLDRLQSKYYLNGIINYDTLIEYNVPFDSLIGLEIVKNDLPMNHDLQDLISYVNQNN